MKKARVRAAAIGLIVTLAVGGGSAYAGTTWKSYNTTVAPFNGSGYTSYQTQATTGASGAIQSTSVGGDYQVDARIKGVVNGAWVRIGDGSARNLSNDNKAGASVRVQFSNDLTTSKSVQVTGTWRSN